MTYSYTELYRLFDLHQGEAYGYTEEEIRAALPTGWDNPPAALYNYS